MLASQTRHRSTYRNRQPSKNRDLQVCWANTGKGMPSHTTILHTAATEKIDVMCIQEPWTMPGSKTQSHPGYDCYAPIDSWDSEDPDQREAERPCVMTYVRKSAGLKTQQHRLIHSQDMLWLDVNGYSILNAYRQPLKLDILLPFSCPSSHSGHSFVYLAGFFPIRTFTDCPSSTASMHALKRRSLS